MRFNTIGPPYGAVGGTLLSRVQKPEKRFRAFRHHIARLESAGRRTGLPTFRSMVSKLTRRITRWSMAIALVACFQFSPAFGCKYNVRDVGFVDFGSAPYRLYCYIQDKTPEDLASTFKQISYAALLDSNVKTEMINVDQQKKPDAMRYFKFWEIKSFPGAVLVSPNGQSLVVPISVADKPFKETVWEAMDSVLMSPKRDEILEHVVGAYCVVLLIEGKEAAENKRVREVVTGAIDVIAGAMDQLPKPVERPPHLLVLSREQLSREKVLLWSLGLIAGEIAEPHVAVLYGRARQIGPILKGKEITRAALLNLLSVIGASCECGLDRRWMMGTMLPVAWGQKVQALAAKSLGFDPESPMVKAEISRIMAVGRPPGVQAGGSVGPLEVTLFGYSEQVVEFEDESAVDTVSPAQLSKMTVPAGRSGASAVSLGQEREASSPVQVAQEASGAQKPQVPPAAGVAQAISPAVVSGPVSREPVPAGSGPSYQMVLFTVSAMVLLILAGGTFVVLRARSRSS